MNLNGGYILHDLNWAVPAGSVVKEGDSIRNSPEAYQLLLAIKSRVPIIINVDRFSFEVGDDAENFEVGEITIPVAAYTDSAGNGYLFMNGVYDFTLATHLVEISITGVVEPSAETGAVGKANARWFVH